MKKKIMVVDDEPDQLLTVKQVLEDMEEEYEVICVDSGIRCLDLLKNKNIPDLILLDLLMPEMNGWELISKLKQNLKWRNITVIFLTAIDDETSKITGKNIAEEFIEKPFDASEFKNKIKKVLENID